MFRIVARGPGTCARNETMTRRKRLRWLLQGDAAPEAVGALLMVMRLRGKTPGRRSQGFTHCIARACEEQNCRKPILMGRPYAQPQSACALCFLLAARLVGQAGLQHFDARMEFQHKIGHCFVREGLNPCGPDVTYTRLETLEPRLRLTC